MAKKVKKKRSPLRWVILIGMLVVAGFLYVAFSREDKGVEVTVESVETRSVVASVSESGVVEPVFEVAIAADVSGEVIEMNGKEGDLVKQGDLLVTIRPDNYQSALEQSQAALNGAIAGELQAKANMESARSRYLQDSASFVRSDALFGQKVISKMEWETAKLAQEVSRSTFRAAVASMEAARYQVASSRASLKQARNNLDRTAIFATMNGTLTRQNVRQGERVVGTLQMAGTEVLRIADLSEMQVSVQINENDIRFLRIGDSAHIEVDAFDDRIFKGRVSEIAYSPASGDDPLAAASSDQITNYEVKVLLDSNSYKNDPEIMRGVAKHQSPFRPGMSAQVEIYTDRLDNVLAVPIQAVTIRRAEGADEDSEPVEVVFLYEGGKAQMVEVETDINDDKYIAITKGLKGQERIIVGPYKALSKDLESGMEVREQTDLKDDGPKEETLSGDD